MPHVKLLAIAASAAFLAALPAVTQAEEIVPPNNSAAVQYTETLPTSRGQKDAEGKKGKVKPAKVLGHKNADRLEKKGKQGREVAEFAAETAPTGTASNQGGGSASKPTPGDSAKRQNPGAKKKGNGAGGPASGGGSGGNGGTGRPHGSSALGEVAGQATGASSGQLGLLLPLVILGAIAWAAAFFLRQRRRIA